MAYNNPIGINPAGNQTTGPFTLGMQFTAHQTITINALGAYSAGLSGFINQISVGIFDNAGSLVSQILSFQGTTSSGAGANGSTYFSGSSMLASITPTVLTSGTYWIVASGLGSSSDPNWNYNFTGGSGISASTDGSGGVLTFGGNRYSYGSSFAFPGTVDGGPAPRYGAGTFDYSFTPVPETAFFASISAGLLGIVYLGRLGFRKQNLA